MVIFRMLEHYENATNKTGSTNRERGLFNHFNWSYGCGDMAVRSLGKKSNKNYSFLLIMDERSQNRGYSQGLEN